MRLEKWYKFKWYDGTTRIHGRVYGNPKFEDGRSIITSPIDYISLVKDNEHCKTYNSVYELGEEDIDMKNAILGEKCL